MSCWERLYCKGNVLLYISTASPLPYTAWVRASPAFFLFHPLAKNRTVLFICHIWIWSTISIPAAVCLKDKRKAFTLDVSLALIISIYSLLPPSIPIMIKCTLGPCQIEMTLIGWIANLVHMARKHSCWQQIWEKNNPSVSSLVTGYLWPLNSHQLWNSPVSSWTIAPMWKHAVN